MANDGNKIFSNTSSGVRITQDVAQVLGVASNNLGYLIAKARAGGANGYAYNITESGAGADGAILDGAAPHHNIFSNVSPSEWVVRGSTLINKLKKIGSDAYNFLLRDGFDGYKHNTQAPIFSNATVYTNSLAQPTGVSVELSNAEWAPPLTDDMYIFCRWAVKVYVNDSLTATILANPLDGNSLIGDFYLSGEVEGLMRDGVKLQLCIARFYDQVKYHLCTVASTPLLNTYIPAIVSPRPPSPYPTTAVIYFNLSAPDYMGAGITVSDNYNGTSTMRVSFKLLSWMDGDINIVHELYNYSFEITVEVRKHWTNDSTVLYTLTESIELDTATNTFNYIVPIAYNSKGQTYIADISATRQA